MTVERPADPTVEEMQALDEFLTDHEVWDTYVDDPKNLLGSVHRWVRLTKTAMMQERATAESAGEEPTLGPDPGPASP